MSDLLFNEFEAVSSKQWKQKIQVDLKGADYNEKLIWQSPESISVKPFYHPDEFAGAPESHSKSVRWSTCQEIYVVSVTQANTKALNVLNRGAESILFALPVEAISVYHLLKNINLSETTIYFKLEFLSEDFIIRLKNYLLNKNARVYINYDLIGNLAKTGNWYFNLKQDHEIIEKIIQQSNAFSGILSVDMALYQNAGANMVQQLAYGLAHANEYLNHINNNAALRLLFEKKNVGKSFIFQIATGSNYFFEIAKIRALRQLWEALAKEYGFDLECHIVSRPSKRNKTIYDYNTNMLRSTTECMSAIIGGADSICNLPYDALYHKDNEFAERISRNQLLILKHESYFDKVHHPAHGAYYIESLTEQLSEKALALFKDIEANGGFLKQLKEGTIQRKIKESADKAQLKFDSGDEILLGTNQHLNPKDVMAGELELYPFVKINKRKTLIQPIIPTRLAEKSEQLRLKKEEES